MCDIISQNWHSFDEDERAQFWATLALRYSQGLGPRLSVRLLRHFGSAYAAIQGLEKWKDLGIKSGIISSVAAGAWRENALVEWKAAQTCDAHIVLWHHSTYPQILRTIIDAPLMFYAKGALELLAGPCLAVVGSRKCTPDGVQVGANISRELSAAGVTIVSGMARGIDKVVHVASLQHVGKSIAVLGTGIDVIYPKNNADIYGELIKNGLIISEYAPQTQPLALHFPIRNRIISGISLGVLVVEGALKSGTLITARQALEQNRDVFAIPGTANALASQGCQELIRQGAKVVFTAEDILCDMMEQFKNYSATFEPAPVKKEKINENQNQKQMIVKLEDFPEEEREDVEKILNFLYGNGESHMDSICIYLKKPANTVSSVLMSMELQGLIKRLQGAKYIAKSALK